MENAQLDKQTYKRIVKYTLQSMVNLAKDNREYNLQADVIHYYESTIKQEMVLSTEDFLELCKEVGIK